MQRWLLGSMVALVFVAGCRSDILNEEAFVRPRYGAPVARVTVVDGAQCGDAKANIVNAPEHCLWPSTEALAPVLSVDVRVVSQVGKDGTVEAVRVLGAPAGNKFDDAAIACARRAEYRAPAEALVSSETCPITLRFARYVTDLDPNERDKPCPPTIRTYGVYTPGAGQGGVPDPNELRCP
jgi:TonB family protein